MERYAFQKNGQQICIQAFASETAIANTILQRITLQVDCFATGSIQRKPSYPPFYSRQNSLNTGALALPASWGEITTGRTEHRWLWCTTNTVFFLEDISTPEASGNEQSVAGQSRRTYVEVLVKRQSEDFLMPGSIDIRV